MDRKNRQSVYGVVERIRRGSAAFMADRRRSKGPLSQFQPQPAVARIRSNIVEVDEEPEKISFYDRLNENLFRVALQPKKYSDIIRTVVCARVEKGPEIFVAREAITNKDEPDKMKREMIRTVKLIEVLANHFGPEEAEEIVVLMTQFLDDYEQGQMDRSEYNLQSIFDALDAQFPESPCIRQVRKVLQFLHLTVVLFAIEEMRDKLNLTVEHLTKDKLNGWEVTIRLNEQFVEICHTRQEGCLRQKGQENYWEIGYKITMSFSPQMDKFNAARLKLTDLQLSETMEKTLAEDLKKVFFNGNLIIC